MVKRKTLEDHLGDLDSSELQTKLKALKAIGRLESVSLNAVTRIISLLQDDNWKIRAGAARALGDMGQQAEASIPYLINTLGDQKVSVRADATVALGQMGNKATPAIPLLKKALSDPSYSIRVTTCGALGSIGPSAVMVVSDLMKILSNADNFTEKYCAWEAIKAILSNNVTPEILSQYAKAEDMPRSNPFIGKLESRVTQNRIPTKKTIERYILDLENVDLKKRTTAMRKLSDVVCMKQEYLDSLIIPIIPIVTSLLSDKSWKVRSWAARLLGRIGPQAKMAVPFLTIALQDQMSTVRECAAYALGLLGPDANESIPVLEKALHDPNKHVRACAHMSLEKLRHTRKLSEKIDDDDDLDCYKVDDDGLDIHYWVVGYKEHIHPVVSDRFDDGSDAREGLKDFVQKNRKNLFSTN